ncbi:MAG: diacylglycerol kinase [Clostridia bacterium]|nr:diacylglycerol kinase [Clostridia bacterium]
MDEKLKEKGLDQNVDKVKKNKTLFSAMKNALNGIIHVFKTERNLRIDYFIGAAVLICSLFFDFTKTEMICLILTIGFVIFAEMINSTVEYVVDLITEEYNEKARAAKDIAAGGVLIAGGISVIVAYFLFVDKITSASTALIQSILSSRAHLLVTILFVVLLFTVVLKAILTKKGDNYVATFPSSRVTISFGLATYLYIVTRSLLVGGVTLALAFMISSLKKENDKVSNWHIVFSALLGILLVLAIYQITLVRPFLEKLF